MSPATATAAKMTKDYPVFDCDGHINDADSIWTDYVEPQHREQVRRTYWKDADHALLNGRTEVLGGSSRELHRTGVPYSGVTVAGPGINKKLLRRLQYMRLTQEQKDYLDHRGNYDPVARTKEMDLMGIDQVMVIPTMIVNHLMYADDVEGAYHIYRAYNNWLVDYCKAAPGRLYGAAMVPMHTPYFAEKELRRCAQNDFKVGLIRPVDAKGRYPNKIFIEGTPGAGTMTFDSVFKTFEETRVVLGMHTFPSLPVEPSQTMVSPGDIIINVSKGTGRAVDTGVLSFCFEAMVWLTQVLLSGFLDRYPGMRMAVFESNGTWLPALLERCDRIFKLYKNERVQPAKRLPSEAFYDQCFIAFEGDEAPVFRQWDRYENVGVWSSDAYHHDGADSWAAIKEMEKEEVPASVQAKLLGANARRMYGIEGKLFVREQMDIPRPDWFPRQDEEFKKWWEAETDPRRTKTPEQMRPTTMRAY